MIATAEPRGGRKVGRKSKDYKTKQIRMDEETAELLAQLAALVGKDTPDFCREWLRPLVQGELRSKVDELHQKLHGKKKGG
jgi:hypothetical protein